MTTKDIFQKQKEAILFKTVQTILILGYSSFKDDDKYIIIFK